ncbi:hypothetical protein [Ciceribacter sp. L1K22]|uniref:hypothetical protein n=1 Tax=Ciceribacter sp. L1K22 TaxID=2820275 RepID=UPI001ABE45C1|nr:hypothetical protein [Ciceribacter sp. L1K22]MBO3762125.1 hypothetical protein [Ciceribacter sp. L1K22]
MEKSLGRYEDMLTNMSPSDVFLVKAGISGRGRSGNHPGKNFGALRNKNGQTTNFSAASLSNDDRRKEPGAGMTGELPLPKGRSARNRERP